MMEATQRAAPGDGGSMIRDIFSFLSDSSLKQTLAPLNGFQPEEVIPKTSVSPQRRRGSALVTTDEAPVGFILQPVIAFLRAFCGIRLT